MTTAKERAQAATDRNWLIELRQRLMQVLLQMNSSNFGMALSLLHDVIKDYDQFMRDTAPPQPKRAKRRRRSHK
jgi:hypothetical protein